MNLAISTWLNSSAWMVMMKWTCLLAMGWCAHGLLLRRQARWRLIVWRSLLCFGLILPLVQLIEIPGIRIPIETNPNVIVESNEPVNPNPQSKLISRGLPNAAPANSATAEQMVLKTPLANEPVAVHYSLSWADILVSIWALGFALGGLRLMQIQWRLSRLRKAALPASPEVLSLTAQIKERLGVRRRFEVRTSDTIVSPFVCGLVRPVIMLPESLAQDLAPDELRALLNHEMAHIRQNDLAWCVAWQWMRAVCWFHPLVWRAPAAHSMACEQEADLRASAQMTRDDSYAQLLARLALRVVALPALETRLTVNGSSQIAKRLNWLGQRGHAVWNAWYSLAAFSVAGLILIVTAGCRFAESHPAASANSAKIEFDHFLVIVLDDEGKPVEGATITPTGFRVKGRHSPDAYSWRTDLFGPPEKAVTDKYGKAYVRYPIEGIPDEKEYTGQLIFRVSHPDFVSEFNQGYSVDTMEAPIQLKRGIPLTISAFYGADHQPVTDLVPILTDGTSPDEWHKNADGTWQYQRLSAGGHLLQIMGKLASGEIVYGDTRAFTAKKGDALNFQIEMKPGIRLEGRLDDNVPRPVKNGRVMIDVRPKEYPALDVIEDYYSADEKYGGRHFWHSYRPIEEDGSFVFESVPPGDVDVSVLGDGFTIKTTQKLQNRVNGELVKGPAMAVAEAFPLAAPVTKIIVATEPTATLEFEAVTKHGKRVEGIWVGMYPSVFRMWGPAGWQKKSSEAPYKDIPPLTDLTFSGKTDSNGTLVISNIPAETRGLDVSSPDYQVPIQQPNGWRDRHVRISFAPGEKTNFVQTVERKGTDYIGTAE